MLIYTSKRIHTIASCRPGKPFANARDILETSSICPSLSLQPEEISNQEKQRHIDIIIAMTVYIFYKKHELTNTL
jgi:hypothetical protein